jgi:hypothetical protein
VGHAAYVAAAVDAGIFESVVSDAGGTLASRDGLFAAFADEPGAIGAALAVHERAPDARIAVHAGPSVANAAAGSLVYEGAAPTATVALLEECQPGEVATTHVVLGEPRVSELVGTRPTRVQTRRFTGERTTPVVYLRGRAGGERSTPRP